MDTTTTTATRPEPTILLAGVSFGPHPASFRLVAGEDGAPVLECEDGRVAGRRRIATAADLGEVLLALAGR